MIGFDQALAAVLQEAQPLPATTLALDSALGRILAEPLCAAQPSPLFDNSAVDGFGIRVADLAGAADTAVQLPVTGTICAGHDARSCRLEAGAALKIFTGAMIPAGVEAVVMRENCVEQGDLVTFTSAVTAGAHIRRRGEEYGPGDTLLPAGIRITPSVLGLLASAGCTATQVHRVLRVQVLVTGDELVPPGQPLSAGQIYESNALALRAALRNCGVTACETSHLPDDPGATRRGLAEALAAADVIITIGGISMGDCDHVRGALTEIGVHEVFWQVRMKPGKPNYFGVYAATPTARKLVFGLPGNPVSAQVSCHQFVRPAILRLMGLPDVSRRLFTAKLERAIQHKTGRHEFLRGQALLRDGRLVVGPVAGQGSHMQAGLAMANCLIDLPDECAALEVGAQVVIEFVDWQLGWTA